MSITYEEALGTLTAMFSDPWTEESLDTVLRHFEGHMENTVDAVLSHGDASPQELVMRLEHSKDGTSMEEMDEQLARQLASQEQTHQNRQLPPALRNNPMTTPAPSADPDTSPANSPVAVESDRGIGTPTTLPQDFLKIPGIASSNEIANDEALARMLQDKLFADEIKNNPEFAHLARGRARPESQHAANANQRRGEPPEVLKALQGMGEQAKRRFQVLATKFKTKLSENQRQNETRNNGSGTGGGASERRGLLDIHDDDGEQEISFVGGEAGRPDYEMRSMSAGAGKKDD